MAVKYRFTGAELREQLLNTIEAINLQIEDGVIYADPNISILLNATLTENITQNVSNYKALNLTWNQNYVNE